MWTLVLAFVVMGVAQAQRRLLLNLGCADSQRSSPGDLVRLGKSTGEQEGVLLGPDPRSEWEGLCAGEIMQVGDTQVEVEMITRRLGRNQDFEGADCGVEGGATRGDVVTYTSRARIPTVIYMRFPHPKGNIPIRMRQRGQPGITIDRSTDTASLGTGSLPPGWEKGLAGSCVGERRMLLLSPSMAFGEAGIFHKIPANAPLELMVEVLEIKRPSGPPEQPRSSPTLPVPVDGDPVLEFLRQGSTGKLFSFGNFEEEEEEK